LSCANVQKGTIHPAMINKNHFRITSFLQIYVAGLEG